MLTANQGLAESHNRTRPKGVAGSAVSGVVMLALLVWQFAGVADDGAQIQVLDPGLGVAWKGSIVGFVAVGTACSFLAWRLRGWTTPRAVVNAVTNAGWAGLTILLTLRGELFAPTASSQVGETFETTRDWSGLTEPFILLVLVIAIWDSVDALRQARRNPAP